MSFVTVTHPTGGTARVAKRAVQHLERSGWSLVPDATVPLPPKSASKDDWVQAAGQAGIPNPEESTKDDLIDRLTDTQEEN